MKARWYVLIVVGIVLGLTAFYFAIKQATDREVRINAKAAKFDEVCRHVRSYLRDNARVLKGATPVELELREHVASDIPNYAPIRWCVEFPDEQWLACTDNGCKADILFKLSKEAP